MAEADLFTKFLDGLATAGPLAIALGLGVLALWRRLSDETATNRALTREVLTALNGNTNALDGLRDAIERGEHRPQRRTLSADGSAR